MDEVLAEEEVPLSSRRLLRQGGSKRPTVRNKFEGPQRGSRVTWSNLDEVPAEEQVPLCVRKLLRQGRLKRHTDQNDFEGHWRGY